MNKNNRSLVRLLALAVFAVPLLTTTAIRAERPAVYLKGAGRDGYTGHLYLKGTNRLFCLNMGSVYELVFSGGQLREAVYLEDPDTGRVDQNNRIVFGVLHVAHWADNVVVSTYKNGTKTTGLMLAGIRAANSSATPGSTPQEALVDGRKTSCFENQFLHFVPPRNPSARPHKSAQTDATIEIQGQRLSGTLYMVPLKDRNGSWISPAVMFGEYFVVMNPSQRFVYGRSNPPRRGSPTKDVELFWGEELLTNAAVRELEDGRLELSPQTPPVVENPYAKEFRKRDTRIPKAPSMAPAAEPTPSLAPAPEPAPPLAPASAPVPLPLAPVIDDGSHRADGQIVFGRIVEVQKPYRPWRMNDLGVFDALLSKYTDAISRDSSNLQLYEKRANIYRRIGEFTKALADSEKAGKPLEVEVVSENAPVQIGTKIITRLSRGTVLRASKVNGKWLQVEPPEHKSGWIDQRYVR